MAEPKEIHICGETVERIIREAPEMFSHFESDARELLHMGVEVMMDWRTSRCVVTYARAVPWFFKSIADPPPLPDVQPGVLEYISKETP